MLVLFFRVFIVYVMVVLVVRMMGKRQVAQMQPFELVVTILIADLAAIPMGDNSIPLIYGVVPIITLLAIQVLVSYLSIKNENIRELICGKPSLIINKGQIIQSEIKRLRINMNDLLEQLRGKEYPDLSDIEFAILETNGVISVIPKANKRTATVEDLGMQPQPVELPVTLVVDGEVIAHNLEKLGHDQAWLDKMLKEQHIDRVDQVFYAFLSSNRQFYVQKKEMNGEGL